MSPKGKAAVEHERYWSMFYYILANTLTWCEMAHQKIAFKLSLQKEKIEDDNVHVNRSMVLAANGDWTCKFKKQWLEDSFPLFEVKPRSFIRSMIKVITLDLYWPSFWEQIVTSRSRTGKTRGSFVCGNFICVDNKSLTGASWIIPSRDWMLSFATSSFVSDPEFPNDMASARASSSSSWVSSGWENNHSIANSTLFAPSVTIFVIGSFPVASGSTSGLVYVSCFSSLLIRPAVSLLSIQISPLVPSWLSTVIATQTTAQFLL